MVDLKPIKKAVQGSSLLLRRWAVLGALVVAVGAVAVWGGMGQKQEEPQGAAGLLMEQLQAHIGADADGEVVLQPVSGGEIYAAGGSNGDENKENEETENNDNNELKDAEAPDVTAAAPEEMEKPDDSEASDAGAANVPEDEEEVYDYAPDPWLADAALSAEAKLLKMLAPVSGGVCSRGFGYNYDPTFKDYRFHGGLDIEAALGTAVLCPMGAEVGGIEDDGFGGQVIVLEHGDKLVSRLEGLTPAAGLAAGDKLSAGDKLGEIGDPPLLEDAQPAHLHWELLLDGEPVDASAYGYGE